MLKKPDGSPVLLGQKRGIVSAGDTFDAVDGQGNLFLPGIFHLGWNNGTLEASDQLQLPQRSAFSVSPWAIFLMTAVK